MRHWFQFSALGDPNTERVWEILSKAASMCSMTPEQYWTYLFDKALDKPSMRESPPQDVAVELAQSIINADRR